MNVDITGRHVKITPAVEQYARAKAERVAKFVRSDARVEIILDHEHDRYQVEMIVSAHRGPVVIGHIQHEQVNAAIDLVVDKVDHQLRRMRDRRKSHHGTSMSGDEKSPGNGPDGGLFGPGEGNVDDVLREE